MFKKSRIIILIVILSTAILAAGFFIFKDYLVGSTKLTDFLPPDTKAYFELNVKNKEYRALSDKNFKAVINLDKIFAVTGFWGVFNPQTTTPNLEKVGLVFFGDGSEQVWLLQTDGENIDAQLPAGVFSRIIKPHVWAVAKDREVLDHFDSARQSLPLETQTTVYSKFGGNKFLNAYLSADFWRTVARDNPELNASFFNKIAFNPDSPFYLSLRADNNLVVINIQAVATASVFGRDILASDRKLWQGALNKDIIGTWQVGNLRQAVDFIEQKLITNLGADEWNLQKNILAKKYNFSWGDFYDLTSNPAVLFVADYKSLMSEKISSAPAILLLKMNDEKKTIMAYQKIKDFLSYAIAFQYPTTKEVKLGDNTTIKTLVADPKKISWQSDIGLEYFSRDGFQVALRKESDKIYVSNATSSIMALLNATMTDKCPEFAGQEIVTYRAKDFKSLPLKLVNQIVLTLDQQGEGLNIRGCLEW